MIIYLEFTQELAYFKSKEGEVIMSVHVDTRSTTANYYDKEKNLIVTSKDHGSIPLYKYVIKYKFLQLNREAIFPFYGLKMTGHTRIENDKHEIIVHRGYKTSYFINGIQIGYYEKRFLNKDFLFRRKIVLNHDTEINIVLPIMYDIIYLSNNWEAGPHADLGNFWFQKQPFNDEWEPTF